MVASNDLTDDKKDFTNIITIEKMTIRGLSRMMKKHFGLKKEPIFISTTDKWNVINSLRKQNDPRVEFPFMTFKLVTFEINPQSYNPKSLPRFGVMGEPNDSQNGMNKNEPVPVNIAIEMTFLTDDIYTMLNFCNRWTYVTLRKRLNMTIEFDGVNYDIQCETDSSLSVPEKDMQIEQVNAYELAAGVIVHGYVSPATSLDNFPKAYPFYGDTFINFAIPQSGDLNSLDLSKDRIPIYDPNNASDDADIIGYEQLKFQFKNAAQ